MMYPWGTLQFSCIIIIMLFILMCLMCPVGGQQVSVATSILSSLNQNKGYLISYGTRTYVADFENYGQKNT